MEKLKLIDQEIRNAQDFDNSVLNTLMDKVNFLRNEHNLSTTEAIEFLKVVQMQRRSDLIFQDGDIYDSQFARFSDQMKELIEAIQNLKDSS